MGSGKHSGSSETSSEEIDQPEKATTMNISDDNAGVGRSYECTFCKRGFTNAQALGGHMNIHRKDKAKAKQKSTAAANNKSLEDHTSSYANNTFAAHDSQRPYTTAMAAYMSYQLYFPSSNNVPTYLNGYNNRQYYDHNCDTSGSLSLSIGPPPHRADGDERRIVRNDVEVDLELRLGHHP